jgi:hypothetical protein
VYNLLGYSYAQISKLDYAINAFEKYIELAPEEPNPYDSMGEILQIEGRIDEAVEQYKKALDKNPDFRASSLHLIDAYLDRADFRKAEKLAGTMAERAVDDAGRFDALLGMARVHIVRGQKQKALSVLGEMIEKRPEQSGLTSAMSFLTDDIEPVHRDLQRKIEVLNEQLDRGELAPEALLQLLPVCLRLDYGLESVDRLLDGLIESATDPFVLQSALAYKQVIGYRTGYVDPTVDNMMERYLEPHLLELARQISWEEFWRFYYAEIGNTHATFEFDPRPIKRMQQAAIASGNLRFAVAWTYNLALLASLEGDERTLADEMRRVGTPLEGNWTIFGPFDNKKGINQVFWPEREDVEEIVRSRHKKHILPGDRDGVLDGYLDLRRIAQTDLNQTVYAVLPINSPTARTVYLRFGPNRSLKAWMNGYHVMTKNKRDAAVLDKYIIPVRIRAGTNHLLVKQSVRVGEVGLYFRITDETGYGFEDITFGESPAVTITERPDPDVVM